MADETTPPQHLWRCRACKVTLPGGRWEKPWVGPCPACGRSRDADRVSTARDGTDPKRSSLAAAATFEIVRVPTGIEGFDKTIGGGLVPGDVVLLGGQHSAGKSTLLVAVLDGVARLKGSALYASSEQGVSGIIAIGKRLGLQNDNVEVLGDQHEIEPVLEHARETKPFCLVADSLNKFRSQAAGGLAGSNTTMKAVVDAVRDYCRETKRCAIIVNQLDKSGAFKGSTDASHDTDAVLALGFPRAEDTDAPAESDLDCADELGVRMLVCEKNRAGPGPKTFWYMAPGGVLTHVPPQSKLIEFPGKRYRKD
jgi:predicted ATP-dependent serine protease